MKRPPLRKFLALFGVMATLFAVTVFLTLNKTASVHIVSQVNDKVRMFLPATTTKGQTDRKSRVNSTPDPNVFYEPVCRGTNVQVGDLDLYLTTAVYSKDYPVLDAFNVRLNGWVRHKAKRTFKCCLLRSLYIQEKAVEVDSETYHVYKQWIVDMQNAEFSCSLPKAAGNETAAKNKQAGTEDIAYRYVTFAESSCLEAPRAVLTIEVPKTVSKSVGVCLKISYGSIQVEQMVEWFEYVKLLGVTRVFTFLARDLDKAPRDVLLYYEATGFLDANPIDLAKSRAGPIRHFRKPRDDHQAFVDEVMAANDCKLRMSGLDYVMVVDLDEYIIPKDPNGTYLSILQTVSKDNPTAGTFRFNSYVFALDWKERRPSPLHTMSAITRTMFPNYDGADRNTRWAFQPHRTFFVQNNRAWPRPDYRAVRVPDKLYLLAHRRWCKRTWPECRTTQAKVEEPLILRYEKPLVEAMKRLPLAKLLPNSTDYIKGIHDWGK